MAHTILVTGSNGQLGTEIRNIAAGCDLIPGNASAPSPSRIMDSKGNTYIFTARHQLPYALTEYLDITDMDSVSDMVAENAVDIIVNCAAYTDVDKAEGNPEDADLQNHIAPGNLAEVAREMNAALIHISTDYIFGGDSGKPYREFDETAPLGVYGLSKLAGERAISDSDCSHVILRTSWLYSPYGRNFVKTMLRLTREKESIDVVMDQTGSPTYAKDLAAAIAGIIESGPSEIQGIFHFSDCGVCSRYDLAYETALLGGGQCRIHPCRSEEFPTKAVRPHFSALDTTLFRKTFGQEIPHWRDSLKDCIDRIRRIGSDIQRLS